VLATYDAICHDLRVRSSPVLLCRLLECEAELLRVTGTTSVEDARLRIAPVSPPAPTKRPVSGSKRSTSKRSVKHSASKSAGGCRYRYCQDARAQGRKRTSSSRALPTRISSVVSGGLPGSARRH
jgi:hypothetical protein